jgi:hypothetical protein
MNKKTYIDKDTITALGWKVTTDSRYRLDEHKRKLLDQYNTNRGVLEACENVGVNVQNVPLLWLKNKNESVSIRNPYYKPTGEEKLSEEIIIEELVKKIIPISTAKVVSGSTLILWIGDCHIGMQVNSDAPISSTVFDFKASLLSLLSLVNQPFEEVVVVYGGDMADSVHNSTSRGGHHLSSTMTTREMFEVFILGSKEFFTSLILNPLVGNVRFVSVGEDNHLGALAGVYSRALEIWLNAQYPDVITNVFFKTQELIEVKGHKFVILHGKDATNQFKNHPLVLTPKTESFFMSWCLSQGFTPNYKNTHIVKFDLHQSSYQLSRFFSYLNCLSLQIGSGWQQSNFMSSIPGCTYSIVSENGVLNGEYLL